MSDPQTSQAAIAAVIHQLGGFGQLFEPLLLGAALALAAAAVIPIATELRRRVLAAVTLALVAGEAMLVWFHLRLYALAVVVNPETGQASGQVAVPIWVESEKLYVWALIVSLMALVISRHRDEMLPGLLFATSVLCAGAALWGKPFTEPLPQFLSQYGSYLDSLISGDPARAFGAYQGMEGARQFYYNTWYMWVHPPLLFISYGAFVVSFVAVVLAAVRRYSAYESQAYWWARLGYLPLTAGMLLGLPWAILAWQDQAWWWSGKVNMSIMMWLLYTAYLHARLHLRRRGMWRWVVALNALSFVILVLTYLATYIVPGAHSYA